LKLRPTATRLRAEKKARSAAAPPPPARRFPPIGQILLARAAKAAARPELTAEEKGLPPPELANQQHPDYPPGYTYANAHREKHGRVQIWPVKFKEAWDLGNKFQQAIGQLAKLSPSDWPQPSELAALEPKRREQICFGFAKVTRELLPWLAAFQQAAE